MTEPDRKPDQRREPEPHAADRGGSLSDMKTLEDEVAEASDESFPASYPPSFTGSTASSSRRNTNPRR